MSFELGESVILNAEVRDVAGVLYAPATVAIMIKGPDGAIIINYASMFTDSIGIYNYYFTIPDEPDGLPGKYKWKVKAVTANSLVTIATGEFTTTPSK